MTEPARATEQGSAGTDVAFEALYAAHHRAVLAHCSGRSSRPDAWDAASEVFVVAWRRFDEVPTSAEARPWLLAVAYRVLANQRRSTSRRRRLLQRSTTTEADVQAMPDVQLIRNEEEAEVIRALSKLRPADREIIQLALWEELPPVEIAEILGISRDAVDQRFSRAKKRLAKQLDKETSITGRATRLTSEEGGAT